MSKFSKKIGAKIFFGPNPEHWSAYLGKSAKIYEEKIKNENRHETGLSRPKIEFWPRQALGGGGGGFFGLGGPNHNALTQIPEKNFCPTYKVYGS
jgi:hypothetical protein